VEEEEPFRRIGISAAPHKLHVWNPVVFLGKLEAVAPHVFARAFLG
jgi:hypothetical protein